MLREIKYFWLWWCFDNSRKVHISERKYESLTKSSFLQCSVQDIYSRRLWLDFQVQTTVLNVFRTHPWSSASGVKGRLHWIHWLQSKNPHTLTGMISLGAKRNMKGILTSCGQGCVIVGAWRTAWATRAASQCQLFNKGFAGWNWRTKITQWGVLGKWDEGCKTGENAIRDKSRVQFNVFQSLSPFPAVSCAYEGGRKRCLHIACQQLSH